MKVAKRKWAGVVTAALVAVLAAPASATTLIRASLDHLTDGNGTVVVGEVVDAYSYWNEDGTFILTDVRVAVNERLKGKLDDGELTVTIMGGTVGDLTTLIVGGAELIPDHSYVLFLDEEDLPGARGVRTVRDHCQGVFEVEIAEDGLRAVSQANGHPLLPDASGAFDAPGGAEGFPLEAMIETIRERA
ncbi:MAG TPA: hypothetical protein VGG06_04840, partial [Thermoanaerobaculia bacterium]